MFGHSVVIFFSLWTIGSVYIPILSKLGSSGGIIAMCKNVLSETQITLFFVLQKVSQINLLYLVITLEQVFYEHKPMIHKCCMNTTIVVIFS